MYGLSTSLSIYFENRLLTELWAYLLFNDRLIDRLRLVGLLISHLMLCSSILVLALQTLMMTETQTLVS